MCRVRFQLFTQVSDVYIHDMLVIVGVPPDALQQLGTRKHTTGMLSEGEEQSKLTRSQFDRLTVERHFVLRLVYHEIIPVQQRRGVIKKV